MNPLYYEIQITDLEKCTVRAWNNRIWLVHGLKRRFNRFDLGKRLYKNGTIVLMETDEEFKERIRNVRA